MIEFLPFFDQVTYWISLFHGPLMYIHQQMGMHLSDARTRFVNIDNICHIRRDHHHSGGFGRFERAFVREHCDFRNINVLLEQAFHFGDTGIVFVVNVYGQLKKIAFTEER